MNVSGYDMIYVMENLLTNNNIAGCRSEILAFAKFVTGLVEDFDIGIMSRDDFKALFEKYAGSNPDNSKFFYVSGCL